MELIVDYEVLIGARNELVVKEIAVVSCNATNTFHFTSPYSANHKVNEINKLCKNGINWNDGYIPYNSLKLILEEATAGFTHLYAYGQDKCTFLSELTNRTFINLEEFNCPNPTNLKHEISCTFPCHKFNDVRCATKHAEAMFRWLMYHIQAKKNVRCPPVPDRHSASFISAIPATS